MPNYISIPVKGVTTNPVPKNTKTSAIDFENHRLTSRRIDGIEAVEQYIHKALITPRFKCLIYGPDYGSQIKQLLMSYPTQKYLEASMEHIGKDAIIHDSRILSMDNFVMKLNEDEIHISFTVQTIYGEREIEEVI